MQKQHLHIGPISSIHFRRWINNYTPTDCTVHVISLDNSTSRHRSDIDRLIVFPVSDHGFRLFFFIKALFYLVFRPSFYDLIHIHSVARYSLFALPCFFLKSRIVVTPWGSDINFSNPVTRLLQFYLFSISDYITTDAFFLKQLLVSRYKVNPKKIKIVNFGVCTSLFMKKSPSLMPITTIISLRNHEPVYCIDHLIKAFLLILPRLDSNTELHIYGSGTLTPALKSLVPGAFRDRIKFIGRYDAESLPYILFNASIYVNTSSSDAGIASSTQEALAAGLPVISTDVCDNAHWLESDKCDSILFRSGVDTLASSLLEGITKVQQCPGWGLANQYYAQSTFSIDSQRNLLYSIYS